MRNALFGDFVVWEYHRVCVHLNLEVIDYYTPRLQPIAPKLKPVQHVTVMNTVGSCNTKVSICVSKHI